MKKRVARKEYIKHQHKLMVLIGLFIVIFSYHAESRLWVIFGSLIVGAGLAHISYL